MGKIVQKKNKGSNSSSKRNQTKRDVVLSLIPYKGMLGLINEIAITGLLISCLLMFSVLLIMLMEKITITVGK